ncbi:hypothetical protein HPB49_009224 [Dermacentor silvarum]|uniref:Uncharacterized protein n=1 Tax=Dermacentor silvarum TaxID=543639 RepID=A0ACB8CKD8_DERSI|nr:hypothetical protein HPB49_009224 [Dermacentor silvarum]
MPDSRLLHLWEAYNTVHHRWQAQKHNRRLRRRLARLASDMEEHCSSLLRQQWGQTCDRMAGNTDFLAALRDRYLCTDPLTTLPAYTGSPKPDLEADISLREGTPRGSVLSPLLFNVPLFPLARALRTIPALSHAFYADHITLWVTTGNLGDMETTLQAGVDALANHARSVGLSCSPAKSELLLPLLAGWPPCRLLHSPSPLTAHPFPSFLPSATSGSFFSPMASTPPSSLDSQTVYIRRIAALPTITKACATRPPPPSPGLCSQPLHLFSSV